MSMHPNPAERLLSMLEEAGAVESLPVAEVHEELAVLGIDPARSIAFAKSLARDGGSPGGRLMGALLAGQEEDEEIARIESADIEDVRAHIPHAAAAAIAAEARRKAGIDDNLVGLDAKRRKRRRLIVWGGPLAGIAASVLVVVVGLQMLGGQLQIIFNTTSSYLSDASDGADYAPRDIQAEKPDEEADRAKEKTFADAGPAVPEEQILALNEQAETPPPAVEKKSVVPAKPAERLRKQEEYDEAPPPVMSAPSQEPAPEDGKMAAAPAAPVGTLGAPVDTLGGSAGGRGDVATDDERRAAVPRSTGSPDLPGLVAPPSADVAGEAFQSETETAALPQANQDGVAAFGRSVEISEIVAVLVVDPSQAPLQIQSPILPSGELANRVEEARRLAGDRAVIALYSVATGDARRDFAQVPLQPGQPQQMPAPSPLVGLLGVEATEYDFIALPVE